MKKYYKSKWKSLKYEIINFDSKEINLKYRDLSKKFRQNSYGWFLLENIRQKEFCSEKIFYSVKSDFHSEESDNYSVKSHFHSLKNSFYSVKKIYSLKCLICPFVTY